MRIWKMKLDRRKKEANGGEKSSRAKSVPKRSHSGTSSLGASCLKNSDSETSFSAVGHKRTLSATTTNTSVNETTVTTSGSSSRAKAVHFDVVEIRNYERIASDNPCCTSGPPIGIGWNHGGTHRENIDNYEKKRGRPRSNLDFVLSRSEREAILLEWDIDMKTIAASTRAAMKTKFQRKQTFINSRKLSKLEDMIEATSIRLKNVFGTRRRASDIIQESLALTRLEIIASDVSRTGETASITSAGEDLKSHLHVTEPECDEMEHLMKQSFDIPAAGLRNEVHESSEINDDYTLGATTLGNTTCSPSVVEMEKFYRELELEMFGEEIELPSMVGQTLEVHLDPESDNSNGANEGNINAQDERFLEGSCYSHVQSAHLERYPPRPSCHNELQCESYDNGAPIPPRNPHSTYDVSKFSLEHRMHQHYFDDNRFNQPDDDQHDFTNGGWRPLNNAHDAGTHSNASNPYIALNNAMGPPGFYDRIIQYENVPIGLSESQRNFAFGPSGFQAPLHPERDTYHQYNRQRGRSFDSSYNIEQIRSSNGRFSLPSQLEQGYSYFQPGFVEITSSRDFVDSSFRCNEPSAHRSQRYFPRSSQDSHLDEPRAHHMPMRGRLSANEWMNGIDDEYCVSNDEGIMGIGEGHFPEISQRY